MKYGLLVLDATQVTAPLKNPVSDFDGDGKTDLSVYNQSTGDWLIETSSNNISTPVDWGTSGDMMEAGDFDGDGKSDMAIFRPSEGNWYILGSTPGFMATHFGQRATFRSRPITMLTAKRTSPSGGRRTASGIFCRARWVSTRSSGE